MFYSNVKTQTPAKTDQNIWYTNPSVYKLTLQLQMDDYLIDTTCAKNQLWLFLIALVCTQFVPQYIVYHK